MLRPEKWKRYGVADGGLGCRQAPGAANVWQHLRSFARGLFADVRAADLLLDPEAGEFFEEAADWAYMVPIVEQAGQLLD